MLRVLGLAIGLFFLVAPPPVRAVENGDERPTALIGVREDAMPFVWRESPDRDTYRGFLYDLCTDATTRAGYHFELVPVSAADREAIIRGEQTGAFEGLDLFCDPTTISLERLDHLARSDAGQAMVFSPILFVANGSYVERSEASNRTACRLAVAGGDPPGDAAGETALSEEKLPVCDPAPDPSNCFGRQADGLGGDPVIRLAGHVGGTTARNSVISAVRSGALRMKPEERICLVAQTSHIEGVGNFCAKNFDYYFGDVDIIEAYIRQADESASAPCDFRRGAALTYEPYAVLITSKDAGYRSKLIAALYEIFSDGTAAGRFSHHFGDYGKSRALDILFRINGVPGMRNTR